MLLFKKILDYKTFGALADKRGATRFPVGAKYPLIAKVTLMGRDGEGHVLKAGDARAMDWGGQLVNLSAGGASLRLHPSAMGARGENCRLKLELDHKLFELDGTIAHFWSGPQYATCGVALIFPDNHTQKAFCQLVEPVAVGSKIEPVEPRKVKQDVPGLIKEQYKGEDETMLSAWRDETGKIIAHFELLVHDYCIRGSAQSPGLQLSYKEGAKPSSRGSRPAVPMHLTPSQQVEVRYFFQLIVPNIPKSVPSDVRGFLDRFTR